MELLLFLESIRNPMLDLIFLIITNFGEIWFSCLICVIILWCVDIKKGYKLLCFVLTGTLFAQLFKVIFRVPRPFAVENGVAVVPGANPGGYSFPSGHTTAAISLFGGLFFLRRDKFIAAGAICMALLVAFSRLYLGAHTLLDVAFPLVFNCLLLIILNFIYDKSENNLWARLLFNCFFLLIALAIPIIETSYDPANPNIENAWMLFGLAIGFILSREFTARFRPVSTKASLPVQCLKILVGTLFSGAIYFILDFLFDALGNNPVLLCIKACAVLFFAAGLYPLSFNFWFSIGHKTIDISKE